MENASKALIMVAGVLIGILVLTLAVYLVATFGSSSAEIQKINENKLLTEFNSKFTVYEGREDLTIYDVINVVNYAKENNDKYDLDRTSKKDETTMYIRVMLDGISIEDWTTDTKNNELEKNELSIRYTCKSVKISKITKRVYEIKFTKN